MLKWRIGSLFAIIAMVMSVSLMPGDVYAADASGFVSGVQIQNLSSTEEAVVLVVAYNKDGTEAATADDTIPASSSRTYFPLDALNVTSNFNGSMVVNANVTVAAIVNTLATSSQGGNLGASYSSIAVGGSTVVMPLIMKDNSNFDTSFNVQNASTADANVTVTYVPRDASSGNTGCTQTATIKPGAAASFDQRADSNYQGCTGGLRGDDTRFVGSATVSAPGGNIVATALEVGPTTLFAYNGFSGGATLPVMPLINANNSGFVTGIQIANQGSDSTEVTVTYTPSAGIPGNAAAPCTETQTVPGNGSATFALGAFASTNAGENCPNGAKFVGAGKVTANSTNQPLNVIANQLNNGTQKGAAYGAPDPAGATDTVSFPLIFDNNGSAKFFTGFSVANVGDSPVTINCVYSEAVNNIPSGKNTPPPSASGSIAPGLAFTVNNNGQLRKDNNTAYVGSAICTATGTDAKIVGIVNELAAAGSGDQFLVYEGFNSQ